MIKRRISLFGVIRAGIQLQPGVGVGFISDQSLRALVGGLWFPYHYFRVEFSVRSNTASYLPCHTDWLSQLKSSIRESSRFSN